MKLNEQQKHMAMMQASPSYAKHPETFYLEMRALETPVTEALPKDKVLVSRELLKRAQRSCPGDPVVQIAIHNVLLEKT